MEGVKSGLKLWKENFFLIHHRAIPFHMPWRHPNSCTTDRVPTSFNQDHVDRLKAYIVKLHDILEGVLVRYEVSRVWHNPMCDPMLRRSNNTGEPINVIPLRTFDPSIRLDVIYPPILLSDKEVEPHQELPGGMRRTTRASFRAPYAPDTQPLDTDVGADDISSDGNVDSYFDARVSNTAGDVLERDLLPFVPGPYYIPYPFDEGSGSDFPPYTRDDWEEIHGVNLAETHRLRKFSSVELSNRMSVLECQLITYGIMLNARYDHSLRNVERLLKQCAQQTQTIKKKCVDLKQQSKSTIRANEEVSRLMAELGALKSKCKATEQKLSIWDKKHRKYGNERDALAIEKEKIEEELSDFTLLVQKFLKSGEFNQVFAGVLNTSISVGVERGLYMDHTDEKFRGLSHKVAGFISDAKEKFDRVIAAFPDTTFPFLDKTSSAATSLRANTHIRHSTSSFGTFGHTSTPELLGIMHS
ncbi:hypothetical protein Tco_1267612 [Tanacetum coccineum]